MQREHQPENCTPESCVGCERERLRYVKRWVRQRHNGAFVTVLTSEPQPQPFWFAENPTDGEAGGS